MLYAAPHPVNADPLAPAPWHPPRTTMVELNLDAAELPDEPDALYALAHRLNLACGGHAGDARTVARACSLAKAASVRVGAHPSFPDRAHFGRRALQLSPEALADTLRAQCAWLRDLARAAGLDIAHVKLHGALYHAAHTDPAVARTALAACCETLGPVTVIGMARGHLAPEAARLGVHFLREGFADRGYAPDGALLPRDAPGALLGPEAAAAQCRALVASGAVDTVCVHGDGPDALAVARAVRAALESPR